LQERRDAAAAESRTYLQDAGADDTALRRVPRAIREQLAIAERCAFRLDKLGGEFPLFPSQRRIVRRIRTAHAGDARCTRTVCLPLDPKVERSLEYELASLARRIRRLFPVVWDIAQRRLNRLRADSRKRPRSRTIGRCATRSDHGDRSGRERLLFERFLSEERGEVPDIDIDFGASGREKVIQYVYELYGREHARWRPK